MTLETPETYDKLITLAKLIARPWVIATWVLAGLLVLSVVGNVYLATQKVEITIDSDANFTDSDNNVNTVQGK